MPYDPLIHHRQSIRLPGYDYTQPGSYFITIVTHRRMCLFGEIADGAVRLNEWGKIACAEWLKTAAIRPEIALDEFVIMPNHIHAVVTIMECDGGFVGATGRASTDTDCVETVGATGRSPLRGGMPHGPANKSLSALIAGYKSAVTTRINQSRGTPGVPVWQRNYYEHIIRNECDLSRIRKYIRDNPAQWETDAENRG